MGQVEMRLDEDAGTKSRGTSHRVGRSNQLQSPPSINQNGTGPVVSTVMRDMDADELETTVARGAHGPLEISAHDSLHATTNDSVAGVPAVRQAGEIPTISIPAKRATKILLPGESNQTSEPVGEEAPEKAHVQPGHRALPAGTLANLAIPHQRKVRVVG